MKKLLLFIFLISCNKTSAEMRVEESVKRPVKVILGVTRDAIPCECEKSVSYSGSIVGLFNCICKLYRTDTSNKVPMILGATNVIFVE